MHKGKMGMLPVAFLLGMSVLSSCSSIKKELGMARNSPDEFLVVKRAPLTLPPEYTLRPPVNAEAQRGIEATKTAETALTGKSPDAGKKAAKPAKSDTAFLEKIGTDDAHEGIRDQIEEDNGYISLQNRSLSDQLIFWKESEPAMDNLPSSVVDSKAEAERLKQNAAEGKAPSDGKVPTIEKKKSTIERLF